MQPAHKPNKKRTIAIGVVIIVLAAVIAGISVAMAINNSNTKRENEVEPKDCVEFTVNGQEEKGKVKRCSEKYIGMEMNQAIEEARKDNLSPVVTVIDGKSQVTVDIGGKRVHFEVENGKVVKAIFAG